MRFPLSAPLLAGLLVCGCTVPPASGPDDQPPIRSGHRSAEFSEITIALESEDIPTIMRLMADPVEYVQSVRIYEIDDKHGDLSRLAPKLLVSPSTGEGARYAIATSKFSHTERHSQASIDSLKRFLEIYKKSYDSEVGSYDPSEIPWKEDTAISGVSASNLEWRVEILEGPNGPRISKFVVGSH
jgi:hypothetical protein